MDLGMDGKEAGYLVPRGSLGRGNKRLGVALILIF